MPAAPKTAAPKTAGLVMVGHVAVGLEGDATHLGALLEALGRLFVLGSEPTAKGVTIRLSESGWALGPGKEVYKAAGLQVVETASGFYLRCGASVFEVSPGVTGRLYLGPDFWEHTSYERREFFLLGLLMLLRPLGLYGLHACGLRKPDVCGDAGGDVGALLVGGSGAGKTTTTLNLIRHGWDYLSDDAVLLREAGERVEAVAFRKGFSCTPKTLLAFPGLRGVEEFGDPSGKRVVDLGATFGGGFVPRCTPRLLLFPRLHAGRTELRPLPNALALVRLSQQSGGIMTAARGDNVVSRGQLELLKRLVRQAQSFELLLGEDALHDLSLVSKLLEDSF